MKITIQNRFFEAEDITAIEDVEKNKVAFRNREAGFVVITGDGMRIVFRELIPYERTPSQIGQVKDKWEKLQNEAIAIWQEALKPVTKTIIQLEAERLAWALKTFPEATALSSLYKLQAEVKEIEENILLDIKIPEEYADALMCLFDSAARMGITPQDIFKAFEEKLEINKGRKWVKNPDNSYSHIKP
jgi:hypothetical protein